MRKKKTKDLNRHNKAFKYRIYPNAEQIILFSKTFGCVGVIYNKELYESMEIYKTTGEHYIRPYARYKEEFEWLKEVDSLALANAQLNLETAYKNFFDEKEHKFSKKTIEKAERTGKTLTFYDLEKHPKFKRKHDPCKSYTTNYVNGNIEIIDGMLKLPKVGKLKMKQHRSVPNGYVLKSVTVSKTPSGKYYASILFEYDKIIIPATVRKIIGLDFSMAELYVDSNGEEPLLNLIENSDKQSLSNFQQVQRYNRFYRRSLAKLQKMSRALSKMVKFSNNWYKQKHKIAVLHEKIANQRKDFLHKESREIANSYDLVGVEDLDMQDMSQCLNFGKSVHDNGFGTFRKFLQYKLEEQGKHFITIDKWFPSSKKCSTPGCNYIYKDMTMDIREWTCPECGVHHNRDHNAAINIRNEAFRIYSENLVGENQLVLV